MGKAQSKRSVDITTDPKKGPEEEVTGKMEKIEDVDQKEVNGDATIQEKSDAEKKDAEETENDKDLTTEKSSGDAAKGGGDSAEQNSPASPGPVTEGGDSPKEDANVTKEGASTEETTPVADESIKKSKKDKVKKKWSLRSISFGKKDKQKPAKTEETAEASPTAAAAATNGEAEKPPAEGETAEVSKKEGTDEPAAANSAPAENGETKTELNGEKTPTEVNTAANDTNKTTETSLPVSNDTAIETQTEKQAAAEPVTATTVAATTAPTAEVVTNGNADDSAKNGVAETEDSAPVIKAPECAVESNKTIPSVEETPHQNGTNGDANEADEQQQTTNKSQIEVKTIDTSSTTTTSMNNIVVNDQAETSLVLTQTVTTSKSFQTTENSEHSNEIVLVSSSSSISDRAPHIQTIPPTIEEEWVVLETALKKNSVDAAANSDEIKNSVDTEEISKDISIANVEPSSIENPVEESSATTVVCTEVVEKQSEVQAPPLPASPPPSRVSVFAFKDNDVDDFVKEEQKQLNNENTNKVEVEPVIAIDDAVVKDNISSLANSEASISIEEKQETLTIAIASQSQEDNTENLDLKLSPKSEDQIETRLQDVLNEPNSVVENETVKDTNVPDDSSVPNSDIIEVDKQFNKSEVAEQVSVETFNSDTNLGLNSTTETDIPNVVDSVETVDNENKLDQNQIVDVQSNVENITLQAVEIIHDEQESQEPQQCVQSDEETTQQKELSISSEIDHVQSTSTELSPKIDNPLCKEDSSCLDEHQLKSSETELVSIEQVSSIQDSLNANANITIDSQNEALKSFTEDSLNANNESKVSEQIGSCDILSATSDFPGIVSNISTTDEDPKLLNDNKSLKEDDLVTDCNRTLDLNHEVKEINAKDLKENAAAETTQDLPVTCE